MSSPVRRLGRGLESLISSATSPRAEIESLPAQGAPPKAPTQALAGITSPGRILTSLIDSNPFQPRSQPSDAHIHELAESIRQGGIIQPIVVRQKGDRFQIIAGERRYLAAKLLGWTDIPAYVRDANDAQMLELALVENLHREDLNPIDRALAYQRLCVEFQLSAEQVAQRVSEDRTTVVNYLRLLDLSPTIQRMVADGMLSMGHARAILGIDEAKERERLAGQVAREQLSVRAVEQMVRDHRKPSKQAKAVRITDPNIADLQERFEKALSVKVRIIPGLKKSTGQVVVYYESLDDFDRIATKLGVAPGSD